MGWPEKEALVASLGASSKPEAGKIENVEVLGSTGPLKWTQEPTGLRVQMPPVKPCDHAIVLKITRT